MTGRFVADAPQQRWWTATQVAVPSEVCAAAARTCAAHAVDPDDLRRILGMLGLLEPSGAEVAR